MSQPDRDTKRKLAPARLARQCAAAILLGLAFTSSALSCRDFSRRSTSSKIDSTDDGTGVTRGAAGQAGEMTRQKGGAAGQLDDSPDRTRGMAGGKEATGGEAAAAGGARPVGSAGEPEPGGGSGSEDKPNGSASAPRVSVSAPLAVDSKWTTVFAFSHDDTAHWLGYSLADGGVTFQRLGPGQSLPVWGYTWDTSFRLFPHFQGIQGERYAPYIPDKGERHYDGFEAALQGPLIFKIETIRSGFTLATAQPAAAAFSDAAPALHWYDSKEGVLLTEFMHTTLDEVMARYWGAVEREASALTTTRRGDLLLLYRDHIGVLTTQNIRDDGTITELGATTLPALSLRTAALEDVPDQITPVPTPDQDLFFAYWNSGRASLLEYSEELGSLSQRAAWTGQTLADAKCVTSTLVGSHVSVLVYSSVASQLQVIDVRVDRQ